MYRRRMAIGHQDHPRWVSNTAEVAILFTLSVHANYRGAREGLATQIKSLVVPRLGSRNSSALGEMGCALAGSPTPRSGEHLVSVAYSA
jgi:hypothetical protein